MFGREIHAFFVGDRTVRPVLFQGAIHAREWASAEVCMDLFLLAKEMNIKGGYWFLPVMNPDGVLLATRGIATVPLQYRDSLLQMGNEKSFPLWKANGRGVDLNVNFNARYGKGKENVFAPASENYVGTAPESEPCTRALTAFTRAYQPRVTVSLHTKGGEIYWQFPCGNQHFSGDKRLGKRLFSPLGYPMKRTPGSTGGYKDWCIQAMEIPAYTVELFSDTLSHPVPKTATAGLTKVLCAVLANMEKILWKNKKSLCAPH